MATDYYIRALDLYRAKTAEVAGCAPEDFDRHSLVIVRKPDDGPHTNFTMMVKTFGTGTVVSVAEDYLEWATENAPKDKHYRALFPNAFLQPLVEEGQRRGETIG